MLELEPEATREAEVHITDLDPHTRSSRTVNRWGRHPHLRNERRLWMALFTLLEVALFAWVVVSPLRLTGAASLEPASTGYLTASRPAVSHPAQMVVVQKFIYLLDQDGLLRVLWIRHKYVYLLWQRSVAPSSRLLGVDHNVVYLAAPDGRRVALRASDGAVLWIRKGT